MAKILIVDDSITIRKAIRYTLTKAALFEEILEARDGEEAIAKIEEHNPDIVICDIVMPKLDGFETLKIIKENPKYYDLPIIMLTAQESVEKKVMGLELGASDYLTKPPDHSELIARVKVQMKIKHLQDELKQANERYKELARTDYLTGLFNRRYFMEVFESAFERCRRYSQPLGFVIMDLDHFKKINDTMGHHQGDSVLSEFARLLKEKLRSHDTVARYGGEEFVIALPMATKDECKMVAQKIRKSVEAFNFTGMGEKRVTVSAGAVSYPFKGISKVDELIARADDALYAAKEGGRNCVMFAEEEGGFKKVED